MKIDLTGKTVLITGGSKGIGKSLVQVFFSAGATTVFTYNDSYEDAKKIAKSGRDIFAFKMDMKNSSEIISTYKQIKSAIGCIDILINNAGIWTKGTIGEITNEILDKTLRINLTGTFILTNEVVKDMKKNKSGKIVNISSTAAQRGEAGHSHYAATKGAINSFTKSLATELGYYNINVNAVAPGWVDTSMNTGVFSNKLYLKNQIEKIPLNRIASPEDIAFPVLFLSSEFARHITGEILNVNGGSVLCG